MPLNAAPDLAFSRGGVPANAPGIGPHRDSWFYIRNDTGDTFDEYVFVAIDRIKDSTVSGAVYSATKPAGDGIRNFAITLHKLPPGKVGRATVFGVDGGVTLRYSGTAPTVGGKIGTKSGQYKGQADEKGCAVLGVNTDEGQCVVRPFEEDDEFPATCYWVRVECDTLNDYPDVPGVWMQPDSCIAFNYSVTNDQGASWYQDTAVQGLNSAYKVDAGAWTRETSFRGRTGVQWPQWCASVIAPTNYPCANLWLGCYTIYFNHAAGPFTGRFIVREAVSWSDPNLGDLIFSTNFVMPDGNWSDFQVIKDGEPVGAV